MGHLTRVRSRHRRPVRVPTGDRVDRFEQIIKPQVLGLETHAARCEAAIPQAMVRVDVPQEFLGDQALLSGDTLTIPDLLLAPQITCFALTPEG